MEASPSKHCRLHDRPQPEPGVGPRQAGFGSVPCLSGHEAIEVYEAILFVRCGFGADL